ncbi:MAG: mandelate racemase/muconate lactonizing enzyme family protein, partial [Deltaproteobacteria bacterium]
MKITKAESFLANAGLRNYLFVRITADNGLYGIGEASLEWQEKAVESLLNEWVFGKILGKDPTEIEKITSDLIRDQYQGGATILTAISSVEIALWDLLGKSCGLPVFKLLGGAYHSELLAYANGWYGGAKSPEGYALMAREVVKRGYSFMKFDPLGTAWQTMDLSQREFVVAVFAKVREAVGPRIGLILEIHGRLSTWSAIELIRDLKHYDPFWCEEPVPPEKMEACAEVRHQVTTRISAGERWYQLMEHARAFEMGACDIVQPDIAHCGGLLMAKKIAALGSVRDITVCPHVSIGPVALAAALHFDISTSNFYLQETFSDFDVPWRDDLVGGWNPLRNGRFELSDQPGLGLDLNLDAIMSHPYQH